MQKDKREKMGLLCKQTIAFILCLVIQCNILNAQRKINNQPNIIFIYVDDLGYGDIGCYGANAVKTPNVDFIAANGLRFTDAHCTAATCTPSRFSLLTGLYGFRNNAAILPGDAPLLIKPGTVTLPGMLQQQGYRTAVVGKWHLGLGDGTINWNEKITPGPNEIGFSYSFIIPATTDRVPTVFVENGQVPNLETNDPVKVSYDKMIGEEPTGLSNPGLLKQKADTQHSNTIINGISRIGYMSGGKKARWVDEEIPMLLNEKAKQFIRNNKSQPFFLYYAFPNIHVPRTPGKKFARSNTMGARGDVIEEMDWMTGEIIQLLDSLKITENTLVIFSSDNGPVLDDGYGDFASELVGAHKPSGIYRGGKYSAFEGGTRVPAIVYWKGKVNPGITHALFSQVDLIASIAKLVNFPMPANAAVDSKNNLNVLLGKSKKGSDYLLEESFTFSLRKGNWKYIAPMEKNAPDWLRNKKIETGAATKPQLFNLQTDAGEQKNVADLYPAIVKQMQQQLNSLRKNK